MDQRTALLQSHLAEYNALTTRSTYWIAMLFGLWSLIGVILVVDAQLWKTVDRALLLWGSLLLIEGVIVLMNATMKELYNAIRYIEHYIRPEIQMLAADANALGYESY